MTQFDLIGIIIISISATISLTYITIWFLVSVKSEKEKEKFFREKFIKLREENQPPYRIVDNHYLHYVDGNNQLMVIDLDKLFNHGYTKGEENE